jgi:diguanylate cyclase (GGDEF)-like protein
VAQRQNRSLAVLYLDLDRFKHINDSLGHLAGDRLLQSVALRLTESVRASDTVCRLGGDEFVILLSEVAHAHDAAVCADKLLQAVRVPYVIDEHELHITASVGVETREQRSFLEKHKCTEAQGYYFSRPLKAQAFADFLRTTALRIPNPRSLRKSRSKAAARFSSGAMGDEEL